MKIYVFDRENLEEVHNYESPVAPQLGSRVEVLNRDIRFSILVEEVAHVVERLNFAHLEVVGTRGSSMAIRVTKTAASRN